MTEPAETPAETTKEATGSTPTAATQAGTTGTVEPKATPVETQTTEDKGKEDYEARFKGLQPKVQELAEANKSLTSERLQLLGTISEQEAQLTAAQKQLEEKQGEVDAATKAQEESQGTIDTLEAQIERQTLIMSEFPDLAQMEAKGLINPALSGDELKTHLGEMRSILKSQGVSAMESLTAGSTSAEETKTGARTQGDSIADIDQKMQAAMREGNMEEVNRLEKILIEQADKVVFTDQGTGAPAT
jgi:chromosome segregation ATPase